MDTNKASEFVSEYSAHHGVLGMKWGHRSGRSTSGGSTVKTFGRKIRLGNPITKNVIHHKALKLYKKDNIRINNKSKYKSVSFKDSLFGRKPIAKEYNKEHADAYVKRINEVIKRDYGNHSFHKGKEFVAQTNKLGNFKVKLKDVKHSIINPDDFEMTLKFITDNNGHIIDVELVDDPLAQGDTFVKDYLKH